MPSLDVSELNIVIAVLGSFIETSYRRPTDSNRAFLGTFIVLYGFISVKIKQVWYLGEARELPIPSVVRTQHH